MVKIVTVCNDIGRVGVYDITVRNQRDELVAVFRGKSYRIKGKQVVALPAPDSAYVSA